MVALGDTWQLGPDVMEAVKESPAVFSRSSDRMMRAIALYTRYGRSLARTRAAVPAEPIKGLPKLGKGAQPEWLGKKVLAAAGIRVPDGDLARNADEAAAVAKRIGYPVVLKAQAAALSHKTEAGGVMLNLADEAALRAAWDTMMASVKRAAPDVDARRRAGREDVAEGHRADGRRQARSGLGHGAAARPRRHLGRGAGRRAVAARRPPTKTQIREALGKLRSAKLLAGVRGAPPADVDAVVKVVLAIGRLMQTMPEIDRDRRQSADGARQGTRRDRARCADRRQADR